MKRFGLFVLPIVCLIGCNKDTTPKESVLNREQLYAILPGFNVGEVKLKSIEVSWDNKSSEKEVQNSLKELGATDELSGTRVITDANEMKNIRNHDCSKQVLYKSNLDNLFPADAGEYTYKAKEYDIIIDCKADVNQTYTYMASNGIVKSFTRSSKLNNIDYTITDTFNYSYI